MHGDYPKSIGEIDGATLRAVSPILLGNAEIGGDSAGGNPRQPGMQRYCPPSEPDCPPGQNRACAPSARRFRVSF